MNYRLLYIIFLTIHGTSGLSQSPAVDHFLVEEEKFTPPEAAIIEHYLNSSPMAFMANDMEGTERYLGDYSGQLVFLWFWKTDCPLCLAEIQALNILGEEFPGSFTLLSLADDDRATLSSFLESTSVNFPIIPNTRILAEGAYAHDLGYPRLFIIGKEGLIETILPQSYFQGEHDLKGFLTNIVKNSQ